MEGISGRTTQTQEYKTFFDAKTFGSGEAGEQKSLHTASQLVVQLQLLPKWHFLFLRNTSLPKGIKIKGGDLDSLKDPQSQSL